jgi:hypothetical protein
MKNLFVFIFGVCSFVINTHAQDVAGNWYGIGKVDATSIEGNAYLTELVLTQKGKKITGLLNYYFRDSLFTNEVTGSFDPTTRALTLKSTNVIYFNSSNTTTGIDCPLLAYFTLRTARVGSTLSGEMYASKDFKYTCPTISFKLKKNLPIIEEEPVLVQEETEDINNEDTAQVIVSVAAPTPSNAVLNNEDAVIKKQEFLKREKTYIREIFIENNNIQLEFYDNGALDNDSISVFLNNQLILPKTMLEHKAIKLSFKYDDSLPFNELSMYAESLGLIPPNTSLLVIYDGTKRHDVLLTSDFQKNGTIKLVKKN